MMQPIQSYTDDTIVKEVLPTWKSNLTSINLI